MEFNKLTYDSLLSDVSSKIYTAIQTDLDTPNWVGTICSLDIIPSNGQLYPIELNTSILLSTEFINEWDLSPFINHLTTNGYTRVIFRRHTGITEDDEVSDYIKTKLNSNGIQLVEVRDEVRWYSYEREYETDFILQHRWNNNLLDRLAADKDLFFNYLVENNVDVNKQENITQDSVGTYNYDSETPTFFYKVPNKDTGLGVYPVVVDSDVSLDNNFYIGISNDTTSNTRVEISKRSIVGKTFVLDYDYDDAHYVYLPKYKKCDVYSTNVTDLNGDIVKSNFVNSRKTKICQNLTFTDGNMLELTNGTFKDVSAITTSDKIKYYKFNGFTELNYDYYIDNENYYEKRESEYTWVGQTEWLDDSTFKDTSLYVPVDIDIKFKVSGKFSNKVIINDEYEFIKNRSIVCKSNQYGFFRHNYTQYLENGELVNVDGSTYEINSYEESEGEFNGYSFIIDEYDLYTPYFVNMNGIFVLVY